MHYLVLQGVCNLFANSVLCLQQFECNGEGKLFNQSSREKHVGNLQRVVRGTPHTVPGEP